jgi:hypothetical protein
MEELKPKKSTRATKVVINKQKPYELSGRVVRCFGVWIPPKKITKPKKYLTLRFVVTGIVPSKKNDFYSENNVRHVIPKAIKKHGYSKETMGFVKDNTKSWIRGSKRYLEWMEEIGVAITEQMEYWRVKYDLVYPLDFVSIKNYYFFADNTARDIISKDESVYDMLVTKKIIQDDNYSVLHKISSEAGNYKGELDKSICTIDVTYWKF